VELRGEQALELPARLNLRLALALVALALAAPAVAAAQTGPSYDADGNLIQTPFVPQGDEDRRLTEDQAIALALANPKIAGWVARYKGEKLTKQATFKEEQRIWQVKVWVPGKAGQIVEAKVEDASGNVKDPWTGPQVAWGMARGIKGAFGADLNEPYIWLAFCAFFFAGLADWRRLLSVRNLDLLVLLSFSISLVFFNRGEVFRAMPLIYPPLLYLLGRLLWVTWKRRPTETSRPVWPVWVLVAATVLAVGFRIGLNVTSSNTIDVGYASVIGAQRIVSEGEMPYGHMPTDEGKECGPADSTGYVRERIQTNGRCESANGRGDTYGPVTYLAYVPGYLIFGWTGHWDDLPAVHFTSILLDVLAIAGLALVGRRFGGHRLAATLAFAWAAYPFTQYVSNSNSNDAVMPVLLIWGFWLLVSAPARGAFVALAGWAKFAGFLLVPLWASYPRGVGKGAGRRLALFAVGLLAGTALIALMFFLEPDPIHAVRVFWDRTFGWQLSRPSPFSIWDWDQYHYPDLAWLQGILKVVLLAAAFVVYFVPRTKSPLQVAALSGVLLIGFEIVLTHWFYLYIPWFFPFVAIALLATTPVGRTLVEEAPPDADDVGQPVPAS
jgi:hypothetical protein